MVGVCKHRPRRYGGTTGVRYDVGDRVDGSVREADGPGRQRARSRVPPGTLRWGPVSGKPGRTVLIAWTVRETGEVSTVVVESVLVHTH